MTSTKASKAPSNYILIVENYTRIIIPMYIILIIIISLLFV